MKNKQSKIVDTVRERERERESYNLIKKKKYIILLINVLLAVIVV